MTIQISVVLWTLICFAVLYAVLKHLLFKPVLALLDSREEKQAQVDRAVSEAEQYAKQAEIDAENRRAAYLEQQQEEVERQVEQTAAEGKSMLEQARKQRIEAVEQYRAEMTEAYHADTAAARQGVGTAAAAFLDGLYAE